MFKITLDESTILYVPTANIAYITESNGEVWIRLTSGEIYKVVEQRERETILRWAETLALRESWK